MKNVSTLALVTLTAAAALLSVGGAALAQQNSPNQNAAANAVLMAGNAPACPGPAQQGSARCHARVVTDKGGSPSAGSTPAGLSPAQIHSAYSLPNTALSGTPTIAIVDAYNDPNIEKDLAVYNSTYGLPPCTTANGCFKKVNQTGGTSYPSTNAGWSLEIALDVEIAHATCQNCNILLVEANSASFADLLAAEDYATAHSNVVSNSWGANEFSSETSYDSHFNRAGVPITVSSGDAGYGVEYPASSQYVTAVGGTSLTLNSNGARASETVWSGAGSGCSAYEPQSLWQTALNLSGCAKRIVADVSAVADPNTGAAVYDSVRYQGRSGWFQVGGTSLSAPLVASVYALSGNFVGTNSIPYNHTTNLFDVISGSNGSCGTYLCNGTAGYDGPTGLGTPSGVTAF